VKDLQVGSAQAPRPEDPKFDDMTAALKEAHAQNDVSPDTVIAIWRAMGPGRAPVVEWLIYQSEAFHT
jgi:hypothetical protein